MSVDTNIFHLKNYCPSPYLVPTIKLVLELDPQTTTVQAEIFFQKNPLVFDSCSKLFLNGEDLKLKEIKVDEKKLESQDYLLTKEGLTLFNPKKEFVLQTTVVIHPISNSQLEGLYVSDGILCTQCEAEGFRRITYTLDRPDILSVYTVTLIADKKYYPVLLSNGNRMAEESGVDRKTGKARVVFEDPFPKPTYLFAIVAGKLEELQDTFETRSGRIVILSIYSEPGKIDECKFALEALKLAMKWEEEVYSLEYDLNEFKIVAVDSFNMGAMENKGLNIFNSTLIFYDEKTATDEDRKRIVSTIAHEYFHNWTGNRVTIRDWFQLTLKEGLTVYRDRCFTADHYSPVMERIKSVSRLRSSQFPEDNGPLAHPIQPPTYESINNFYTLTVYEKGAEVVGMYEVILGKRKFLHGVKQYLHYYDGQAVTVDEFFASMQSLTQEDISQFKRWYHTSGTPVIIVTAIYHPKEKTYEVKLEQSFPQNPKTEPLLIPLGFSVNLLRKNRIFSAHFGLWLLKKKEETRIFTGIETQPYFSVNENFSAPVKVVREFNLSEWIEQFRYELNPLLKWDALQQIYVYLFKEKMKNPNFDMGESIKSLCLAMEPVWNPIQTAFASEASAWQFLFYGPTDLQYYGDCAFLSQLLSFPLFSELTEWTPVIDFVAIRSFIGEFRLSFVSETREILTKIYHTLHRLHSFSEKDVPAYRNPQGEPYGKRNIVGERELKNTCLKLLAAKENGKTACQNLALAQWQYAQQVENFNDELYAFNCILLHYNSITKRAIQDFYKRWRKNNLVVNRWFEAVVSIEDESILEKIKELQTTPEFNWREPNKCRSLFRSFMRNNPVIFNHPSGRGYKMMAEAIIRLDKLNPIMAADLLSCWSFKEKLGSPQKALMTKELARIKKQVHSKDVLEILNKKL